MDVTLKARSYDPPCAKPPPPRHLAQPEFANNPERRLRRHVERRSDHAGGDERFCHDELDELRQFRRGTAPVQFSLHHLPRQCQPVVLFQP